MPSSPKISLTTSCACVSGVTLSGSVVVWKRETYPCVDLALVTADKLGDVCLHHVLELGLVGDGRYPGGKLAVPDGGVAADQLVVCGGPVDEVVGAGECECALDVLGGVPLHAVHCQ